MAADDGWDPCGTGGWRASGGRAEDERGGEKSTRYASQEMSGKLPAATWCRVTACDGITATCGWFVTVTGLTWTQFTGHPLIYTHDFNVADWIHHKTVFFLTCEIWITNWWFIVDLLIRDDERHTTEKVFLNWHVMGVCYLSILDSLSRLFLIGVNTCVSP